jgi:hypothetical protein
VSQDQRRQDLPEIEVLEENVAEHRVPKDRVYEVCTWGSGPAGSGAPGTEVHVLLALNGGHVVLRLKTARALDEFVGVLLVHRKDVWGEPSS